MLAPHKHTIGITRREMLQVGYSGLLGLGLAGLPSAVSGRSHRRSRSRSSSSSSPAPRATSRRSTPSRTRPPRFAASTSTIPTRTPGLLACEHLPKLAARSDKYAVVRSLSHRENNHLVATHHVLTGHSSPARSSTRSPAATTSPTTPRAGRTSAARPRARPSASTCRRTCWKARSSGPASTPGSSGRSTTSCR